MKILKHFASVLLLSTIFLACNKDNDGPKTDPNAAKFFGKWVGTYGFDSDVPGYFFALNIKSDGVIQELNSSGVAKGEGSWTIQGSTLKGVYKMKFSPFNEYSVLATVNSATGKIEGTWGFDSNGADGGKILLTKQ